MLRLWKALFFSFDGMIAAWRDEAAFRQEVVLAAILIPLACYLAPDTFSLLLMIGSLLLVLIVELLNTAIEATVNYIGTEIHPLAKKAKDTASAAVLIALINAITIWTIVLI